MGQRRLTEHVRVQSAGTPASYSVGTYYNGESDASGIGIDTRGYDQAMVVVHAGVAAGTLDVSLAATASNSTTASSASALSSTSFTQIDSSNDENIYVANILTKNIARYLFVKQTVASDAVIFGSEVILGSADSEPVSQPNDVEFNYRYE